MSFCLVRREWTIRSRVCCLRLRKPRSRGKSDHIPAIQQRSDLELALSTVLLARLEVRKYTSSSHLFPSFHLPLSNE